MPTRKAEKVEKVEKVQFEKVNATTYYATVNDRRIAKLERITMDGKRVWAVDGIYIEGKDYNYSLGSTSDTLREAKKHTRHLVKSHDDHILRMAEQMPTRYVGKNKHILEIAKEMPTRSVGEAKDERA